MAKKKQNTNESAPTLKVGFLVTRAGDGWQTECIVVENDEIKVEKVLAPDTLALAMVKGRQFIVGKVS